LGKFIKVACVLLTLVAAPLWVLTASYSVALLAQAGTALFENEWGMMYVIGFAVTWLEPVWVIYFGWRTVKGWRDDGPGNAILMALPTLARIVLYV
jgi:hypothetical protein